MIRKIYILITVIILIVVLSACTGGVESEDDTPELQQEHENPEPIAEPSARALNPFDDARFLPWFYNESIETYTPEMFNPDDIVHIYLMRALYLKAAKI